MKQRSIQSGRISIREPKDLTLQRITEHRKTVFLCLQKQIKTIKDKIKIAENTNILIYSAKSSKER